MQSSFYYYFSIIISCFYFLLSWFSFLKLSNTKTQINSTHHYLKFSLPTVNCRLLPLTQHSALVPQHSGFQLPPAHCRLFQLAQHSALVPQHFHLHQPTADCLFFTAHYLSLLIFCYNSAKSFPITTETIILGKAKAKLRTTVPTVTEQHEVLKKQQTPNTPVPQLQIIKPAIGTSHKSKVGNQQ